MFLGTPVEEPFRVLVWLFIGLPILAIIISIFITMLTVKVTVMLLMWGVVLAMVGYVIGIPWTFYRFLKGDA